MSGARRLQDLERSERRWAIARLVTRVVAIAVTLLVAYYALPAWAIEGGAAVLGVLVSCVLFVLIVLWLLRRIVQADLPELRAVEALAVILPLFLYIFASLYLAMSHASSTVFSEPLDHTDALYLAITVLSTVGFGDITPKTETARIVVGLQMILDLVLLGAAVRLLTVATRRGLSRATQATDADA